MHLLHECEVFTDRHALECQVATFHLVVLHFEAEGSVPELRAEIDRLVTSADVDRDTRTAAYRVLHRR